jgi:putative endonuclease
VSTLKQGYIYILATKPYGVLYIGVTSDLTRRIYEHRTEKIDGFTKQYHIHVLVYYEIFDSAALAIEREKQLKAWKRQWKLELISKNNPEWKDLYPEISG